MLATQLITHLACLDHDPGAYHPENPRRLQAVLAALGDDAFKGLERVSAPRASDDALCLVHPRAFVEAAVREIVQPDKINLASLGNVVPHLHWHVIPRWQDDVNFPDVIWAAPRRERRGRGFQPMRFLLW